MICGCLIVGPLLLFNLKPSACRGYTGCMIAWLDRLVDS